MHAMIDIETLGLFVDSVIVEIGAVTFEQPYAPGGVRIDGCRILSRLSLGVSVADNLAKGRHIDPNTVLWWMKTDAGRLQSFFEPGRLSLAEAFDELIAEVADAKTVWANGINFDLSVLQHALPWGRVLPWKYNAVRDYRTVRKLLGGDVEEPENPNPHFAGADAEHQARHLCAILKRRGITL